MTTDKIPTTLKLPTLLVEKCKVHYNTENASKAINNVLADFLLLPPEKQELRSFALHNIISNYRDTFWTQFQRNSLNDVESGVIHYPTLNMHLRF